MTDPTKASDEFTVGNELGLHFRAAAMVVRMVSNFSAEVTLANGETVADARSVLDLLTLSATCGTTLKVEAHGTDASDAVAALGALIARNFAE